MKKFFKIVGFILAPILLLVLYFVIAGAPSPPGVESTGVKRVSWTTVYDIVNFESQLPEKDSFVEWLPSGEGLVLKRTNKTSRRSYHTYSLSQNQVVKLNTLTRRASNLCFINDDQVIYNIDPDGSEKLRIVMANLVEGTYDTIVSDGARNLLGSFNANENILAYTSNKRNNTNSDLILLNLESKEQKIIESNGRYIGGNWSRDGQYMTLWDYTSNEETKLLYYSLKEQKLMKVDSINEAYFGDAVWGPSNKHIFYVSNKLTDFSNLYQFNVETGEEKNLTSDLDYDVKTVAISHEGTLAIRMNEFGINSIFLSKLKDSTNWGGFEKINLENSSFGRFNFHPSKELLGISRTSTASMESQVVIYDLDKSEFKEVDLVGLQKPIPLPAPKSVFYPTFDSGDSLGLGKDIQVFIFEPNDNKSGKPYPVLVDIHGGPELQSAVTSQYIYDFYLRNKGFVLIKPNIRGSSGYGKRFASLDNDTLRNNAILDVGYLLDWIETQPLYDKDKIFLMGSSYGGYAVLSTAAQYPTKIAGVVDLFGITNFVTFLNNTADFRKASRKGEYGDPDDPKVSAYLDKVSPLKMVDNITCPVLIYHGTNDPRVPVSESKEFVDNLKSRGVEVGYIEAFNEGHDLDAPLTELYVLAAGISFLEELASN